MEQPHCLEEQSVFFLGHAKIGLQHLEFSDAVRTYDKKNVDRLARIFKLEGCLRQESGNEIAAIINSTVLQDALSQSRISKADLLSPSNTPWLLLSQDVRLLCLYGQHRIKAARRTLEPGDRWWRVMLYDDSKYSQKKYPECAIC
jgi:hypothetical protein